MPSKPTPWLTDEEVAHQLAYTIPRPTLAYDGVLQVLEAHLPRQLSLRKLPQPGAYAYYGADLREQKMPYILLSSSPSTQEMGMEYHEVNNLVIACVAARQGANNIIIKQCMDILTVAAGILRVPRIHANYHGPNQDGPLLWIRIAPSAKSFVPADWPEYSGVLGHWTLQQPPSVDAWPETN